MKQYKILALLIILSCASCKTTKLLKSEVNPEEITNLQLFEPLSFMFHIETGNKAILDATTSEASKRLIQKLDNDFRDLLHIKGKISLADTNIKKKVTSELESIIRSVIRYGNLFYLKSTPVIDSLLVARGQRFGLFTVSHGFSRATGNYSKQYAQYKGKDLLSFGYDFENEKPVPCNSSIFAVIFDAREHEVAFFGKSEKPEQPLDEDLLKKRFLEVFHGYFFK